MLSPLATQYFSAYLYAHKAHHLVAGTAFFADHPKLGDFYEVYNEAFDSLVERAIGNGETVNHTTLYENAVKAMPRDKNWFETLLKMELVLHQSLQEEDAKSDLGTSDLLQTLAGESKARQYFLRQRTKLGQ